MDMGLTGFYRGLPQAGGPPEGQADSAYWKWNPYIQQFEPTQAFYDLQQNGDQTLGTNVDYSSAGGSGVEHFDPGQTPYSFLSAGSNYADTGGVKAAVPGSALYGDLMSDASTRDQQGLARIAALVGGGAALGATSWGSTGYGGVGDVSTGGYGISPGFAGGAEAAGPTTTGLLGQTVPAAGWGPAVGTIGGAAPVAAAGGLGGALGSMGLGGWLTVGSLAAGALQGNKDQTTTSTNAPPAYIAPYLSEAAGAAQQQYGQGAYVSPLQQGAVKYGTDVLNGSYLNSNPYLDATFNRAAGAVTNQVQSNFSMAGRNPRGVDAAATAQYGPAGAGGGYDNLASLIYGGNYQAERDRQQQILPMTNQLGTIGNPSTALDDYIARLRNISGGYGSTTSSTPTQSNLYSGLAGLGLALIPGG